MRTFVTVHDADLIPACDLHFAGLDPTYLFVGPRQPPARADVVHCAAHTPNIEHLRQFYELTAWYVLADLIRTGEVTADRLLLLHYDMRLMVPVGTIADATATLLAEPGPVSFEYGYRDNWAPVGDPSFLDLYRHAVASKGVDADVLPVDEWPTTQGVAWRASEFVEFMDWVNPLFEILAPHPLAGHLAERTIHAWGQSTGRPARIVPDLIWHHRLDSHGTTALFEGRKRAWRRKAAAF